MKTVFRKRTEKEEIEHTIDMHTWDVKNNIAMIKGNLKQNAELKAENVNTKEKLKYLKLKLKTL